MVGPPAAGNKITVSLHYGVSEMDLCDSQWRSNNTTCAKTVRDNACCGVAGKEKPVNHGQV